MAFVVAYLDESADGKKQTVFSIAGYVAVQREWLCFERIWLPTHQKLQARGAVYHTTDLESTGGDFAGWDHQECKGIVRKMVDAVTETELWGCNASVDIKAFKKVFPNDSVEHLYFFCFQSCIEQIAQWGEDVGEPITFVFDNRPDLRVAACRLFEDTKKVAEWLPSRRLGSITFGTRDGFLPLQAADLIAFESYKLIEYSTRTNRIRQSLKRLGATNRLQGRFWEEPNLMRLRDLIHESRTAGIADVFDNLPSKDVNSLAATIPREDGDCEDEVLNESVVP